MVIDYAFVRSQEMFVSDILTKNWIALVKLSMVPEEGHHSHIVSDGLEKRTKESHGGRFKGQSGGKVKLRG